MLWGDGSLKNALQRQERKFPVWAMTMNTMIWCFSEAVSVAGHCQCECSLLLKAWLFSHKSSFLPSRRLNGQTLSSTETICLSIFSLPLLHDTAIEAPLGWEPWCPEWVLLPSLEPGQCWDWLPDTGQPAEYCQARGSWLADHRPEPGLDLSADWAHRI